MVLALLQCQKHRLLLTEPTKAKVVVHQQSAGKKKKKNQELSIGQELRARERGQMAGYHMDIQQGSTDRIGQTVHQGEKQEQDRHEKLVSHVQNYRSSKLHYSNRTVLSE